VGELSLAAYEHVVVRKRRGVAGRPRIALVTPWAPEGSGVADYNARLAHELAVLADVDIVVEDVSETRPPPGRGSRVIAAGDFEGARPLRQYDRIVYCMGNSAHHAHVFELLRACPGAVVMHDVRLTGFYGSMAGRERPEDPSGWLDERLRGSYGSRLGHGLREGSTPNWADQHAMGLYMTHEVQSLADAIFVHSRFARDVLALDGAALERRAPVRVLPFGMPGVTGRPRRTASDRPLIVSLGAVHESKGVGELIDGFAALATRRPDARLVIAGPVDRNERDHWAGYAAELAPAADIELTGRISPARYADLIGRADVAVQLRRASNGEASAAVADCLAAGLPTLVSDLGWAGELPASTVSVIGWGATSAELANRIDELLTDSGLREALSIGGQSHARAHSFADVARAYVAALELG